MTKIDPALEEQQASYDNYEKARIKSDPNYFDKKQIAEPRINIEIPCRWCTVKLTIEVTEEAWNEYKTGGIQGKHVQEIFPTLPADRREMLISQTCPTCWTNMFSTEEE